MCVDDSNVSDPCSSYHIYKLSFLNFLLGKQPNGPGQFMFGTVTWELDTTWLEVTAANQPSRRFHNQGEGIIQVENANTKIVRDIHVLNGKVGAFDWEKALVGSFSVIVKSSRRLV